MTDDFDLPVAPAPGTKDALVADSTTWVAKAKGLSITDADSYVSAGHLLQSIKGLRNEVIRWFKPHLEAAQETKRTAEAARKGLADDQERMEKPLSDAEGVIKQLLLDYDAAVEARRVADERRLQAEEQERAEARMLAAAAEMELEAAATGDEGLRQEAIDILEQPTEAPAIYVKRTVPKVRGISYTDDWKAHPTVDIRKLAAAVAAGTAPTHYLLPNMPLLNKAASEAASVPGVRFYNDRHVNVRP